MRLSSFQLRNYKSYIDSGEIRFGPGINVVVGQNNAGKSALMETLIANFVAARPHRSLATKQNPTDLVNPYSSKLFTVELSGTELRTILLEAGRQIGLPVPRGEPPTQENGLRVLDRLLQRKSIMIPLVADTQRGLVPQRVPSFDTFDAHQMAVFSPLPDRSGFKFDGQANMEHSIEPAGAVGAAFIANSYTFKPERYNVGECPFGVSHVLGSDARNLPEVLNALQGNNPARFNRYNELIRQIFPTVQRVTVRPNAENTQLQISVWTNHPDLERDDLAIPLNECGTGLGQVLAILYVTINSPTARTIVIDEPNTFLHPGAVRTLIEILRSFPFQQFIISTHSSEVIRAAQPSTLSVIRWTDGVTRVDRLEPSSVSDLRSVLREVGATIADVFGSDRIVWVEGQTEEECFRIIVEKMLRRSLFGTAIVAVRDTGAFESKRRDAKAIWEIYERLSHAKALLPPALSFSFDREGRTDSQMEDLVRQSNSRVRFLPRRMLENYALDPDAIVAVLNGLPAFQDNQVSADAVSQWLKANGRTMLPKNSGLEYGSDDWLRSVDAASLLRELFASLSGARQEFRKTEHVPALIAWLAENKPQALEELASYVDGLVRSN